MNANVEGTIIVEGMVEGTLPGVDSPETWLRDWVSLASQAGFRFSLEIEGGRFSLLADETPLSAARIGPDPADTLREALATFFSGIPQADRGSVFSTVRSVEFKPGTETQTLYTANPDGTVSVEQRTLQTQTVSPEKPLTREQKLMGALIAVGVLSVVLVVLALTGVLQSVARDFWRAVVPLDTAVIEVDTSAYGGRLGSGEVKVAPGGQRMLVVVIERGDDYPESPADLEKALAEAANIGERLALEALAKGYIRCEVFDAKGKFYAQKSCRVKALATDDKVEVLVPLPRRERPDRIVVTY